MSVSRPCALCEQYGRHGIARRVLRVLAVDDEQPVLEELVYLLRADPRIVAAERASNTAEALRILHRELDAGRPVDAVFLDIRMPGFNGLDMARVLTRYTAPPAIVFVTAHDDFAVEAFELNAVDYLRKPVRPERLAEAIHRVLHAVYEQTERAGRTGPVPAPRADEPEPPEPDGETVPVELGGLTRFVKLAQVRYAEAQGDYARLHTPEGSFLIRVPLSVLEERWREHGFVRVHRSHLVALRYVEELRLHGGQLAVKVGGEVLAVSRRQARQLRDRLVRDARATIRGDGAHG